MNTPNPAAPEQLPHPPYGERGDDADTPMVSVLGGGMVDVHPLGENVPAVLSAIEELRALGPDEPTVPISDILKFLLEADRPLAEEAKRLSAKGVPGMADHSDVKLQWGIENGLVAGDRRRIRASVLRLAQRLPEDKQAQILEALGAEDE